MYMGRHYSVSRKVSKTTAAKRRRAPSRAATKTFNPRRPPDFRKLLVTEKRRRGVGPEQLVFVGIHNLAQYWWCAQYAVLKSRANEIEFFRAWALDRLQYGRALGHFDADATLADAIELGGAITTAEVEHLLARSEAVGDDRIERATPPYIGINGVAYVDPTINSKMRERAEELAAAAGLQIARGVEPPFIRGLLLEASVMERYPRIRWNWEWEGYTVVGAPDGITDHFVYEFKSTDRNFFKVFKVPVLQSQGDLYGYFWKRPLKRIQRYICETKQTETSELPVDSERAMQTLTRFRHADLGIKIVPPVSWKCSNCEYRDVCPLMGKKR
jgi:hypothetical protein